MALPAHRRLSFEGVFGTLLAPVEEFSFRLNLATDGSAIDPVLITDAAAAAYVTHIAPKVRPIARLKQVKLAEIGADGFYTGDPTVKEMDTPGGGSAIPALPLQVALAVSLVTARRGPTGRGRFFLPAPATANLGDDGLLTAASAQSFATSAAAFLNAINSIAGFGNVIVASTKGYESFVTGVRVGRVPDTIRSRREKLVETYGATLAVNP